jgi:ElaB/YqjD/DUF883 family membrane-anchored ribosome-binding protein
MTENAEGAAGDFTADVAALRQDVARLAETVSDLVKHQVADAQENAGAAKGQIEASIERHPMRTVLIAFGIGMLIGRINRSHG